MADPLDLDALAELERKATPGPWFEHNDYVSCAGARGFEGERTTRDLCSFDRFDEGSQREDAAFVASLRSHARTLIAEARRARALEKYACHPWTCSSMVVRFTNGPTVPCDCGLDALLRREDERG